MSSEIVIRRARKEHQCTERNYHLIRQGDLYLYAAMPPWHEFSRGKKWEYIRACLRCADEYGMHTSDTRKVIEAAKGAAA